MTKIREGTLDTSFVFSKRRLRTLHVDPDAELERNIEEHADAEEPKEVVTKKERAKKAKKVTKNKARKPASKKKYVKRQSKKE